MVKIIIDEECPRCKNRFESLIEFDLNSNGNANNPAGNAGYHSQRDSPNTHNAHLYQQFGNSSNEKKLVKGNPSLLEGNLANTNNEQSYNDRSPFGKESNLTLGKLMNIINLIGETSNKLGTQSLNLIVEQCKLMGLTRKDEQTIYKLADMIQESEVPTKDVLITLYKFCEIIGIKDDVADINYYKLMVDSDANGYQQPYVHDQPQRDDITLAREKRVPNERRRSRRHPRRRPSGNPHPRRTRREEGFEDYDDYSYDQYDDIDKDYDDDFMEPDPGV